MRNKLIAFNVTKALDQSVRDRVAGIKNGAANVKEEIILSGVPISSRVIEGPLALSEVLTYFGAASSSQFLDLGMIEVPDAGFSVMRGELTVGHFMEFIDAREREGKPYEIVGHNSDNLIDKLMENDDVFLTFINYLDVEAYCEWRNRQPGALGTLRPMTEEEFVIIFSRIGRSLLGTNMEWTSTPCDDKGNLFLRSLPNGGQEGGNRTCRFNNRAVRLVEYPNTLPEIQVDPKLLIAVQELSKIFKMKIEVVNGRIHLPLQNMGRDLKMAYLGRLQRVDDQTKLLVKSISLSGCGLTDNDLEDLRGYDNLEALDLSNNPEIGPGRIVVVEGLLKLRELNLSYTSADRLTVSLTLAQLETLKILNISGTMIRESASNDLSLMNLEVLKIVNLGFSAEVIDYLQRGIERVIYDI